ncbi:MAG: glycoside hydrolase family 140 protein [Terriglobia bacterium]
MPKELRCAPLLVSRNLARALLVVGLALSSIVRAQDATPLRFPLTIAPNRRTLVDQNQLPVLIQGDAAWSLIVGLNASEVERYLRDRQQKGFNTLMVNLIEHKFCKNPPKNAAGEVPFTTPGDFTTPNQKYFAYADWVIKKAGEYGIQVLLAPIYLGYKGTDEGFYAEALANGPEKCREYGRYLGRRYKDFDNIIWLMGGDRNPEKALEAVNSVASGIRELDKRHLFTAHVAPESSPVDEFATSGWVDFNVTYTYAIVHRKLLADYNRTPTLPFFLIESTYEGEHNSTEAQIRRQAYWAVLCGGVGHIMGNRPIWLFDPGWETALNLPGSVGMRHWGKLFRSRRWFGLIPDQKHEVVTGGLGEFRGLDFLAAARTPDGSTVIAYMPTPRPITVDLSKVSGSQAIVWWFDPRTGKASLLGRFPTSGRRDLAPPGNGDWVLVVDDGSLSLPPPGSSPPGPDSQRHLQRRE